jgi:hypothetical protein
MLVKRLKFAFALPLLLALAGCGGGGENTPPAPTPPPEPTPSPEPVPQTGQVTGSVSESPRYRMVVTSTSSADTRAASAKYTLEQSIADGGQMSESSRYRLLQDTATALRPYSP